MFGLVDMNSFYASCEQAFSPRLRKRPVVVLSNNDGCIVARSPEAKALGFPMAAPIFEWKQLVEQHNVEVCSSNYALYGDMSARVVSILREAVPRLEIYSIDECFVDLTGIRDPLALASELRRRIERGTGIPCCVGVGPTKVLAKLANKVAKRGAGVVDLTDATDREVVLAQTVVTDVWGIGARWGDRLQKMGIADARALRDVPPACIRKSFGVVMERIQCELAGLTCLELEEVEPDRKQIFCTRSFGRAIESREEMREACAAFVVRAAEKLRGRGLCTGALYLFMHTSAFRAGPQHHGAASLPMPVPTSDTRTLLRVARLLADRVYRPGFRFAKAGVGLLDLTRADRGQADFFHAQSAKSVTTMAVVDRINERFGRGALRFGAQGASTVHRWRMRQTNKSPAYTTNWSDIIVAR